MDARNAVAFLEGGGEMGARMRAFDWAATALGAPDTWPQSLRTVVRIMLDSRYAMWMLWGPDLTFFCNDAYLPTVGTSDGQLPGAVGSSPDITELIGASDTLRETDRRKDEFLATLAHELRNPLAPIRQAARLAQSETATVAQRRWSQHVIERQVRHMALCSTTCSTHRGSPAAGSNCAGSASSSTSACRNETATRSLNTSAPRRGGGG